MDLRSTVAAVARLPFDDERIVDILTEMESDVASNPDDEDHTTFWLVVGDQCIRRGIVSARVRRRALAIIDDGEDLKRSAALGMSPADLRRRRAVLQKLRTVLASPATAKRRPKLKTPQDFLMDVGDVVIYPTSEGANINPYFTEKSWQTASRTLGWEQDGWAALVIVDRGRAFDFLTWYRPMTIARATTHKPALADLRGMAWTLREPGTCSPRHFKRIGLEKIGALRLDAAKVRSCFPQMLPGTHHAISDISIANDIGVAPSLPRCASVRLAPQSGALTRSCNRRLACWTYE